MNKTKLWVNKEKRRYYRVRVFKDLLGDTVLVRDWGSLDNQRGGMKTELLSPALVTETLDQITKRRNQRNYVIQ